MRRRGTSAFASQSPAGSWYRCTRSRLARHPVETPSSPSTSLLQTYLRSVGRRSGERGKRWSENVKLKKRSGVERRWKGKRGRRRKDKQDWNNSDSGKSKRDKPRAKAKAKMKPKVKARRTKDSNSSSSSSNISSNISSSSSSSHSSRTAEKASEAALNRAMLPPAVGITRCHRRTACQTYQTTGWPCQTRPAGRRTSGGQPPAR
mmetsp:Transcript_32682/g.75591  ORF Transcript_32682/g.75591 Transcript_32682/m.75591 type:complete len:205 (+) Transcript_32682:1088-1702(+)